MIHVFFVPGMFGSTIEYILRSYTKEYSPVSGHILDDGSMHSFEKEFHPISADQLLIDYSSKHLISTPIYPFKTLHLPEILELYKSKLNNSHTILLYADSIRHAELNMLFQYYKISTGKLNRGLGVFCGENSHNIVNWNPSYTSWKDMQKWELREWLSLFYVSWVQEWVKSCNQVPDDFLKVKNTDMLFDTKATLLKIIDFCGLTLNNNPDTFVLEWQRKQQYIVDEFNLLDQILINTVEQIDFNWNNLSIISEAIIQQRLRDKGFEIRCDGLNIFPTDSISLYNLLEKC